MKRKNCILSIQEYLREKEKEQDRLGLDWFNKPCIMDWVILLVLILVYPAVIIQYLGYKCGIWLNVPLTYLVSAVMTIVPKIYHDIKWLRNKKHRYLYSKEEKERIMRLINELNESEKTQTREDEPEGPGKDQ